MSDEPETGESTLDADAERMKALDRERLPVQTLANAIPHLRRPFTPEAIRFKVQSVFKENAGCLVVAYIDQRLVTERLNRVIPDKWTAEYKAADGAKLLWCRLTVDGVSRTDIGESPKGLSKDLVSDALKRAAVPFGVGVSCYALPQIKLMMRDSRGRIELRGPQDKKTIALTEFGHETLRAGYERWLEEHGVARFGAPLDHGDVLGATIEEDVSIAEGEGDGSAPGWDLPDEAVGDVEALMAVAEALGHPLDLGSVQIFLNGRPEAVKPWLADTQDMLAKRKPPETEAS